MAVSKNQINSNGKSLVFSIDEIIKNINPENIGMLFNMIKTQLGDFILNPEEKEQLRKIMNVDALEAAKWKTVSDILKVLSPAAWASVNPEITKAVVTLFFMKLGDKFVVCKAAGGFISIVPDSMVSTLLKFGAFLAPDYLIYYGVNKISDLKFDKANRIAEAESVIDENLTRLIIVSKSKHLSSEMDKLINTNDDIDEENQVGTKDGTVHTIFWNEAAWNSFSQDLPENCKVLLIGNIKNTPDLTAENTKFDEFGIKYGWDNNIAKIEADPSFLNNKNTYNKFLAAVKEFQMPKKAKNNVKLKLDLLTIGKLAIFPPILLFDAFRERGDVMEQQLLFGLHNIYLNDLSDFLNNEN